MCIVKQILKPMLCLYLGNEKRYRKIFCGFEFFCMISEDFVVKFWWKSEIPFFRNERVKMAIANRNLSETKALIVFSSTRFSSFSNEKRNTEWKPNKIINLNMKLFSDLYLAIQKPFVHVYETLNLADLVVKWSTLVFCKCLA